MSNTRTITLTDRRPVKIQEDDWPLIASARESEFDNEYEFQANRTSNWFVGVRQHDDGRAIVYAKYDYSTAWQRERSLNARRGVLLGSFAERDAASDDSDICAAIREVCADIESAEHAGSDSERWKTLAADCQADMPAEQL